MRLTSCQVENALGNAPAGNGAIWLKLVVINSLGISC